MVRPDDALLRELEAMAVGLDELDARARAGDEPYADRELHAQVEAKRRRVLLELEVAGALAPADREVRDRARGLGLPKLAGYHEAACELERYLSSLARERLVRTPPPERLIDAYVSLDWFRVPSGYVPAGVDPLAWLALCELNFRAAERPRAGRLFVRLEGTFHQLDFRTEVGPEPHLYRALPA